MALVRMEWEPSPTMKDVWAGLIEDVPEGAKLLQAVAERIADHDPLEWESVSLPESAHRRDNYLIRYGLPLAELYGWPKRNDLLLVEGLAAHFYWALSWRHLDNVLDADVVNPFEVGNLAAAVCRASTIHTQVTIRFDIRRSDAVIELLRTVCEMAQNERHAPVPREHIWQRAAPFLIVPRTLLGLSAERESLYQSYVNLDGLAHDIHDLMTDVRLGIRSLPASWFAELEPHLAFRRDIVFAWFDKAQQELLAAANEVQRRMSGQKFPVLRFFLHELDDLAESLGAYSLPRRNL